MNYLQLFSFIEKGLAKAQALHTLVGIFISRYAAHHYPQLGQRVSKKFRGPKQKQAILFGGKSISPSARFQQEIYN